MTNINFSYPVILEHQSEEGGYLVSFPHFPEAITQGNDEENALEAAIDCLEEAIANRIFMKLDIPPSVSSSPHPLIPLHITLAAKCALYLAMKKKRWNNVTLAKALKCDEKEIRRLLDPKYKSNIAKIEKALEFLGERLILSVSNDCNNIFPKHDNNTHYSTHMR